MGTNFHATTLQGSAALHVAARLGYSVEQIMVAGDGENDLPLFEISKVGARGVIVSNACARLKAWSVEEGGVSVVTANASNAGGILEGLLHHFKHLGYTHRAAAEGWWCRCVQMARSFVELQSRFWACLPVRL